MLAEVLAKESWARLADFIALKTGLHFPPERRGDLQRGFAAAMEEFEYTDCARCAEWVISGALTQAQLLALAGHLTIGETYFLRERNTLDALSSVVLPELIRRRRGGEQRLRLWSAACCTGEEAYSLAILLRRLIPDWQEWHITILASDINARYLRKAATGIYGEWSFRDCPEQFKECHFTPTADGQHKIAEKFRAWVKFAQINLAEDCFPSPTTDTQAMDLILCRNLLLYFSASQCRKLVDRFHDALADQGWLAVSPSECSHTLFSRFESVNFSGALLYRKDAAGKLSAPAYPRSLPEPEAVVDSSNEGQAPPMGSPNVPRPADLDDELPKSAQSTAGVQVLAVAERAFGQRRYAEVVAALLARPDSDGHTFESNVSTDDRPRAFSLLTRAYANQGKLTEALRWAGRWIDANKADPAAHYVHAMILQEKGESGEARHALQKAIYLQPDFALAYFALGNLARADGHAAQARKYFANALQSLREHSADEPLPESDGITVGRLMQTIGTLAGGIE